MVKAKNEKPKGDWLTEELQRINRQHPVVETRYAVAEITPATTGRQGDGHGGSESYHIPAKLVIVSPKEYVHKHNAQAWMDEHVADEGKTLKVVKKTARQYLHWSGWM